MSTEALLHKLETINWVDPFIHEGVEEAVPSPRIAQAKPQ